ncbi:hypothetical protein [Agrobacterium tumefaciens]|uniref:hypothetical protein n=1 Tax=Agrobacterium tumefaciens TaxID=358 RepID=UPI000977EC40|nr:hypothetical protein BV900_22065 [Agrobacterium tumefaciens]
MPTKGRPQGTPYDHYLDLIADIVLANNQMSFNQALRQVLDKHGCPVSEESARRNLRKRWERDRERLVARAHQRATDKAIGDVKRRVDQYLLREALLLSSLARKPLSPIQLNARSLRSLFRPRTTPEDYTRNPFVPAMMTFGEFQRAQEIRNDNF